MTSKLSASSGRLSGVYDGPVNGGGAAYFSNPQYWPSGALQSATYGNGVSQGLTLNSRLQPCHTIASTPLLPANPSGGNLYDRASFYSGGAQGPEPNCGAAPGNNGNIYSIVDYRTPGWTQSFRYDNLNRLIQAARSDGGYNHTYNNDSFGNMLPVDNLHTPMNYGIDAATNRMTLNGDLSTGDLRYYPNGQLAVAPNGLGGSHYIWYTAEGYLRSIDNYGTGSYLYNGSGERTLAVRNNQTATEYVYLNGQPMATYETATGVWSDYIYANGQKIAKVDQQKPLFHMHGTRDGSSAASVCGVEGPWYGATANVPISQGDKLAFDFLQTSPSFGGLALIFTNGDGSGYVNDVTTGVPLYFNGNTNGGNWQHMVGSLDAHAGETAAYVLLGLHSSMPAGTFDMYYANPVIMHANGTVTPLWGGGQASVPGFSGTQCGGYNLSASTDLTPITDRAEATNYYLDDHLGTTQMELGPGGWLLWQGQFTPFGQEIINGMTNNVLGQQSADGTNMPFKFTGKERDQESGLDYFGARYYGSSMGRFMSPDLVIITPERLANPQQLNLYSYVANNPLRYIDPTGAILVATGNQQNDYNDLCKIAGDACADRLKIDAKTGNVTFDTKDLDLSRNEGAKLVNDVVSSKNTYEFSEGPTVNTSNGPVKIDYIIANLPVFGDQRGNSKPAAGVSDVVGLNFDNKNVTRVSNTKLGVSPNFTIAFHELAEAFEKIDGGHGGSYADGHNAALQRELILRDQRPYLKQNNTGAGGPANSAHPEGGMIIKK